MNLLFTLIAAAMCCMQAAPPTDKDVAFLFSSFRGNGEDGLHLAYSLDGLGWKALNQDSAFLTPLVGGKLMRDPCIIIGPDNQFHMVWTSSWKDNGIGIAHSRDLVNWSEQKYIPVMAHEPGARNCWAPEIFWDPGSRQYVIFWATTITDRFPQTEKGGDWNHRLYYTTTKDFTSYSKAALLYDPGFNVIDATIVRNGSRYVMILKDETLKPPAKNLRVAFSDKVTGPWSRPLAPFTPPGEWVEGPTLIKIGERWMVYFDEYRKGAYGAMRSKDFQSWENLTDRLHFPEGTRHGSAFTVSKSVLNKLLQSK
jgi:hypothetical protein